MKYVTAQESQNKLLLLQQSATLRNVAFKPGVVKIYKFICSLVPFIIQQHVKFG